MSVASQSLFDPIQFELREKLTKRLGWVVWVFAIVCVVMVVTLGALGLFGTSDNVESALGWTALAFGIALLLAAIAYDAILSKQYFEGEFEDWAAAQWITYAEAIVAIILGSIHAAAPSMRNQTLYICEIVIPLGLLILALLGMGARRYTKDED